MAPKSWVRIPLLSLFIFFYFFMTAITLRFLPVLGSARAVARKVDSLHLLPRSFSHKFSPVSYDYAYITFDVNSYHRLSSNFSNYRSFYRDNGPCFHKKQLKLFAIHNRCFFRDIFPVVNFSKFSSSLIPHHVRKVRKGILIQLRSGGFRNPTALSRYPASGSAKKRIRRIKGACHLSLKRRRFVHVFRLASWIAMCSKCFSAFSDNYERAVFLRFIIRKFNNFFFIIINLKFLGKRGTAAVITLSFFLFFYF